MIIDNKPVISDEDTKFEEEKISSVVVKTQVFSDEAATIVADNIVMIKELALRMNDIISKTTEFNNLTTKLLEEKYDTKNSIDVLAEANKAFTTSLVDNIKIVTQLQDEVMKVSNISTQIEKLGQMSDILTKINNNLVTISEVGALNEAIIVVSGLQAEIKKIVLFSDQLIRIDANLDKLITIFNYLPQLLALNSAIQKYITLQGQFNFTDEEAYQALKQIFDNINTIILVSNNLTDLIAIKDLLEQTPDLLNQIKQELQSLTTNYSAQLTDQFNAHKKDLAKFVADIKIEIGDLMTDLGKIIANLKCCGTGGGGTGTGVTIQEVLDSIKEGNNITIDRATDSITINANVTAQGSIKAGDNIFVDMNGNDATISTYTLKAGKDITLDLVDREITISSSGQVTPNIPIDGIDNLTGGING